MVRGCQRKVIFLKNCESELFSEAYFIIDEKAHSITKCENDMIAEANRIVGENLNVGKKSSPIERAPAPVKFIFKHTPAFLAGMIFCALLFFIF